MFQEISFCIGGKTLEVNGKTFDLGELTVSALNIPYEEFQQWEELLSDALAKCEAYATSRELGDWYAANQLYIKLDRAMRNHLLFQVLHDKQVPVLREAKKLTAQTSLLEPPHLEIYWKAYLADVAVFSHTLEDLRSFNHTMHHFIGDWLGHLKTLDSNQYAKALSDFLHDGRAQKRIANPLDGTGWFTLYDTLSVRHEPRETKRGSGEYRIYDLYQTDSLQALLKTDFYGALKAGFIIRICENCGRHFLLRSPRHTRYCDGPAPQKPEVSCHQYAYAHGGAKESAENLPYAVSRKKAMNRINTDYSRGLITQEEQLKAKEKVADLYYRATRTRSLSFEEFEQALQPATLYKRCKVHRKTKPRGRPSRH